MSSTYLYDSIYSPWSFPRDHAEQREAEHKRWRSLTPQQRHEEWLAFSKQVEQRRLARIEEKRQKLYARSLEGAKHSYIYSENPHSLDEGEATVTWLIVMAIATIFKGNWIIWIIATAIYINYLCRHANREAKWESEGKQKWEETVGRRIKDE